MKKTIAKLMKHVQLRDLARLICEYITNVNEQQRWCWDGLGEGYFRMTHYNPMRLAVLRLWPDIAAFYLMNQYHTIDDINDAMVDACSNGYTEFVGLAIGRGATQFNRGLERACSRTHIDLIVLMILYGAHHCYHCMDVARRHLSPQESIQTKDGESIKKQRS